MQFAINYSPQAADLLRSETIDIDLFKCPDWPDLVSDAEALKPVYIHFPLKLGNNSLKDLNFAEIEKWLSRTGTRYINTHLNISPEIYPELPVDDAIEIMVQEIQPLIAHFGAERVIVENIMQVPRFLDKTYRLSASPELISGVVEAAKCGFLLDISHAVLASDTNNYDFEDYVHRLPMYRLCELHVTGIGLNKENQPTDHLEMLEADWQRLEWILEQIRVQQWRIPEIMAFEYGGIGPAFEWRSESRVIAAQVPRLVELAHSLRPEDVLS